MARQARKLAKRANRPNPREDRNNEFFDDNILEFQPRTNSRQRRAERRPGVQQRPENSTQIRSKKIEIIPKNLSQEVYLEALNDTSKDIVFGVGPAGTGKTFQATLYALSQLQAGNVEKIIITRPMVSVDEELGILPGGIIQKVAPWVIPILDIFKEYYPVKMIEKMMEEEIIEIAPLAIMRGRTLKNAICIFDEAQNATVKQMKMVLTRIGVGSKMIVTGDVNQHDRGFETNGLKDFIHRLECSGSNRIAVCRFQACDIERHPVIEDILGLYDEN